MEAIVGRAGQGIAVSCLHGSIRKSSGVMSENGKNHVKFKS